MLFEIDLVRIIFAKKTFYVEAATKEDAEKALLEQAEAHEGFAPMQVEHTIYENKPVTRWN